VLVGGKGLQMEFETGSRGLDWLHAWLRADLPVVDILNVIRKGAAAMRPLAACVASYLSEEAESEKLKRTFASPISDGKIGLHVVSCRHFLSLSAFSAF